MDISEVPLREISREVGSVFQDPRSQFFTLHVKTKIPFPSENYGIHREEIQNNVKKSIRGLKLEPLMDREIFNLSSGEKQKNVVAFVYALKPKIYVLDEPTSGLDASNMKIVSSILKEMANKKNSSNIVRKLITVGVYNALIIVVLWVFVFLLEEYLEKLYSTFSWLNMFSKVMT